MYFLSVKTKIQNDFWGYVKILISIRLAETI